ncbi:MAG: hypothetical protein ABID79_01585, partial [Elusimicrobiota bacterium]
TFIIGVIYKFIFVYLHPFSGKEACQKMLIFDKGDAIFYLTCFSIDDDKPRLLRRSFHSFLAMTAK